MRFTRRRVRCIFSANRLIIPAMLGQTIMRFLIPSIRDKTKILIRTVPLLELLGRLAAKLLRESTGNLIAGTIHSFYYPWCIIPNDSIRPK